MLENDIENRFYVNIRKTKTKRTVKRKRNKAKSDIEAGKNIPVNLLKYNLSFVKDSTVIMQAIVSPLIMSIAIFIPNILINRDIIEQYYDSMGLLTGMFLGTAIGLFENSSPINLNSIMVSLDGAGFDYFKALPLDRGRYIKSKLVASTIIVGSCISISTTVMGILMQISLINVFIGISSANLVTLAISPLWIKYDYKHVITNWHNISEVQSRLPKAYIFLMVFLIMMVIVIFIGIFTFLTTLISSFYLFLMLLALEVALAVIMPREMMFFARNHR